MWRPYGCHHRHYSGNVLNECVVRCAVAPHTARRGTARVAAAHLASQPPLGRDDLKVVAAPWIGAPTAALPLSEKAWED